MDESEAVDEQAAATPIFGVYRRGYDPEQVDRYVTDQQRRLDETLHRASESERKLAAAVGQLRELHRRVAVYESEARNAQPPQLDTLGERVQRILQEAWEGAYNLRQEAEREVNELRDQTQASVDAMRAQAVADVEELRDVASKEAAEVVDEATRRALHIRDETERRRQAYLERVERDREQAIAQITYLYDQRQGAIAELARLQASVQATVEEMVRSPLGRPAPGVMEAAVDGVKAARLAAGRAHPAGPADQGSGFEAAAADAVPDRMVRGEPLVAAAEAPHPPGVLGDVPDGQGAPQEGVDVPTGPMERFVRPSDRDAARAAVQRGPDAEADEMERAMRDSSPGGPVGSSSATPARARAKGALGSAAGRARAAVPGLMAPARGTPEGDVGLDGGGGVATTEAPGHSGRGPALGGWIRPRRQAPQQGVYDAEQDGWS
jgi:hypothetical protein